MLGISNVHTVVNGRVASRTDVPKAEMDDLVDFAQEHLRKDLEHTWNAWIDGVVIQLVTNDDHLIDFWVENWFPARLEGSVAPHGRIYAVMGVPNQEPFAYYSSERKTAVFLNTNYYGQCKSWALGMVADVMEMQHDIHSIHGAVVDVGGCGILIIAPTGTGKSTHAYGLTLNVPNARIHSDDWCYVDYIGGPDHSRASATISERKFYLRTDIAAAYPRLDELFRRCKLENVGESFTAVRNSRAMLDPKWVGGPEKFTYTTRIRVVILLRRDDHSPAEVLLEPDDAIEILKKGELMVLPGGGPEELWGTTQYEPFYNPYLLVRTEERQALQVDFFRQLFTSAKCYVLNTGVETVEETQARILRMAEEASREVLAE